MIPHAAGSMPRARLPPLPSKRPQSFPIREIRASPADPLPVFRIRTPHSEPRTPHPIFDARPRTPDSRRICHERSHRPPHQTHPRHPGKTPRRDQARRVSHGRVRLRRHHDRDAAELDPPRRERRRRPLLGLRRRNQTGRSVGLPQGSGHHPYRHGKPMAGRRLVPRAQTSQRMGKT